MGREGLGGHSKGVFILQIETPSDGFPVWVTGQYIILLMGDAKKKRY